MRFAAFVLALAVGLSNAAGAEPLELRTAVAHHVRTIHARNPDLRDDSFAKMGGSSVQSRAFLHCFATPYVDLGEYQELADTVEYFNTGRRNSFNRQSQAAGVSWNLRYVLGGRPAHFREEVAETQGRWALVLFGGNDAQNQNERIYARRLIYLVEELEEMGVVPILGSALPRRNKTKDRWIQRFNAITEAVAVHWELPYIDYHGALSALPRKGLARDGVHPNVLGQGGVRMACRLTEKGLRYGNNARNLLTLEMLDALRRAVGASVPASASAPVPASVPASVPAPAPASVPAPETEALTPERFPFSARIEKSTLSEAAPIPIGCGNLKPGARSYRARLQLDERTRIRVSTLDLDGHKPRVFWVRVGEEGSRCLKRRVQSLEVDAPAGLWDLIIEVTERAAQEGQMLILVGDNPR